jgi:dihydrolipoamide dehydrogenase
MPRSLVVIGAGAVGMEFASVFARFGAAVTVIELLPRVLPLEDEEISNEAGKLLAKQMTIHTGAKTEGALKTANGVEVAFRAADGQAKSVTADVLLVAVGRGPVTDGLGLESTKVQLDRGYIKVDEKMATDEPGIYAIGDVVTVGGRPHPQLAHVASRRGSGGGAPGRQGRRARQLRSGAGSDVLHARVASVGLTEAEAKKRGYDVKVGRFNFGNIAKPRIIGQDFGLVKVVSESKYDEVLGVHMVGPHVTDLISEACVALRLESTVEELMRTIHPHPTLPEALMQAAEAVYGHAIDA